METVAVLLAVSETVTVAFALLEFAVLGVPLITPVIELMLNPDGNPEALYPLMPLPPEGLIDVIRTPTFSERGGEYVGAVGVTSRVCADTVTVKVAVARL